MRADNRLAEQLRPSRITPNYLAHAEGSVLVEAGHTKVICTASVEDRVPPFRRGTGKGWVTAEYGMLPRATTTRTQREASAGKVGGRTQEIQRLIGRSLRAVTKLEELGERTITLDCDVIQADGGTRTASITGAFVALVLALQNMRERDQLRTMPGHGLRRRHERRHRGRRAAARPGLRRGLEGRRRHEHRQDRRRPLHRGAGHGRGACRSAARRSTACSTWPTAASGSWWRCSAASSGSISGQATLTPLATAADMTLLVATTNPGKLREIRRRAPASPVVLRDAGRLPPSPSPRKPATTFDGERAAQGPRLRTRARVAPRAPTTWSWPRTRVSSSTRSTASRACGRRASWVPRPRTPSASRPSNGAWPSGRRAAHGPLRVRAGRGRRRRAGSSSRRAGPSRDGSRPRRPATHGFGYDPIFFHPPAGPDAGRGERRGEARRLAPGTGVPRPAAWLAS